MNLDLSNLERLDDIPERLAIEERRVLGAVSVSVPLSVFRDLVRLARVGQTALAKRRARNPHDLQERKAKARVLLSEGKGTHEIAQATGLSPNVVGGMRTQLNRASTKA